jgi:hypothetical protein
MTVVPSRGIGYRMTVVPSRGYLALESSIGPGDRLITGTRVSHRGPASSNVHLEFFDLLFRWFSFGGLVR